MKRLKLSFIASILTITFAASTAMAGQMPFGIAPPPPPPPQESVIGDMPGGVTSSSPSSDASVTGDMPQGVTSASYPMMELMVSLLQNVFALF